jgi:hypothetical protein
MFVLLFGYRSRVAGRRCAASTGEIMKSGRAAGQAPGAAQRRGGAAAQRDKTALARQNTSSLIY